MKIRSLIFLIVLTLGLVPVLVLVVLSLPKTMERLEYAAEYQTQARSHVTFIQLNARIRCLKKSLIRSATLPSAFAAFRDPSAIPTLTGVMKEWFQENNQVKGFILFSSEGKELFSIHRRRGEFHEDSYSENHKGHLYFNQSMAVAKAHVLAKLVDQKSDPFRRTLSDEYELIMSTPIVKPDGKTIGLMLLRIDMSEFLQNFTDSYWVTEDGTYLRGCENSRECDNTPRDPMAQGGNAFAEFPGLLGTRTTDPLILQGPDRNKVVWMPIIFNDEHLALMWVGSKVDESAIKQWKTSLIINMLVIICIMALLVFFSAKWIAAKIEFIQKGLLRGLDDIITRQKKVSFNWNGPRELKNLSHDLTDLSARYSETCEARLAAETSLRESEDKFRSLTASALDGIILMDKEGNITYWNEAATTIFGYRAEEALGNPIHSLITPHREGEELLGRATEGQESDDSFGRTVELVAKNKNDTDVHVELSLSSTAIKGQWHAIWIVRDTNERKRAEEKAIKQQQQLLLADKMISLGLLVSGVAHEINNPNSIALLNIPILKRSWESAKPILDEFYEENGDFSIAGIEYSQMRHQLPRICLELEESASRIKQIVVDLKEYAGQETSGQMAAVDITEVVKSGVRLTGSSIHKYTTRFISHYPEKPLLVLANRQRLTQVIINLIQNSCESLASTDKSIIITTRYNQEIDGVEISIVDEGMGIALEDLKKVTDPFFTTKRSMGGTGLGLSVSSGIIKEHQGVMNFSSMRGEGTEVVIVFPAYHPSPSNPHTS